LQRYMIGAAAITDLGRARVPATVHVDGTTRAQIGDDSGFVGAVLDGLRGAGRDPVLINTSFNARGEPIVNSGADAVRAADVIGVDFLVVGDALLTRR
jgi:carbamoyltransferase